MKILSVASLLLPLVAANGVFTPYRISYQELAQDSSFEAAQNAFLRALQRDGMVSVTKIPSLFKSEMLASLDKCGRHSPSTQSHTYQDGTVRRTLATRSLLNEQDDMHHGGIMECRDFQQASSVFRTTVGKVTTLFSKRLSSLLHHSKPLLSSRDTTPYDSLDSVVHHGQHLEHFHSYTKATSNEDTTIDYHTDQGLLLVFSPAVLMNNGETGKVMKDGFHVELKNGAKARVEFSEEDELVFMLGDGVNQFINNKLFDTTDKLYAVPHAVSMPNVAKESARVWYGRMVLPPADALVDEKMTFGDLREQNINGERKDLACSSNMVGRQLEELECQGDSIFCWEKCMSPAQFNVSESICAEQGLNLTCTNEERQLYVSGHGPFFPGCIDIATAEEVYGNPTHPSLQNQTNATDDNGHHGDGDGHNHGNGTHNGGHEGMMTSGAYYVSSVAAVVVAALVGLSM